MSTTPESPQNPPQGGFPPPPPPPGTGTGAGAPPPRPEHAAGPDYAAPGNHGAAPGGPAGGYPPAGGQGPTGGYEPAGGQGPAGGYGPAGGQGPAGGYGPTGGYGAPGAPGPSAYGQGAPLSPGDQRTWAVVSHLSGIFVSVIGPLVVWLVFRGRGAYLEDQAKEALNFQIAVIIGYILGGILSVILIGFALIFVVWVASTIFAILAAVAASRGEPYRYPVSLRLIN